VDSVESRTEVEEEKDNPSIMSSGVFDRSEDIMTDSIVQDYNN
jgi:hypothetical protein